MVNKALLKRGITYEAVVFVYSTVLTWLVFGNPFKAFGLSVLITVTKAPLYYIYHRLYENGGKS